MKNVIYKHGAIDSNLSEIIEENNIEMICNEDMSLSISESDFEKLKELAPEAIEDFCEL